MGNGVWHWHASQGIGTVSATDTEVVYTSWVVAAKHLFEGLDSGSFTKSVVAGEFLATGESKPQIWGVFGVGG